MLHNNIFLKLNAINSFLSRFRRCFWLVRRRVPKILKIVNSAAVCTEYHVRNAKF